MLFLLSPAKSLDYESPATPVPRTSPLFPRQTAELIEVLRQKSPQQIATLMGLSDKLAALNVARYAAFSPRATAKNARPAVMAFDGDVYGGLAARELPLADLEWAQQHLRILSGLYGVLRPFDLLQPYRLEMGTALATGRGPNLYRFWGSRIAEHLDAELADSRQPVIVNLASQEYFKAVDRKVLRARVVECQFEEYKAGSYKVVSFFAKRARGLMARYAIQHRIGTPAQLAGFDLEGYTHDPQASEPDRLVFRRRSAPAA